MFGDRSREPSLASRPSSTLPGSSARRPARRSRALGSRRPARARTTRATPPLHEPDVLLLALRVRLALADGDEDAVAGGRVVDVGPGDRGRPGAAGGRWRGRRGLLPRTAALAPGLDCRRSTGSRRGPEPSVPPAGVASAATVVEALGRRPAPGRGARRGTRRRWRPRAAVRRATRRGGGAPPDYARRVFELMEASVEAAGGRRRALDLRRGGAGRG